MATHRSLCVRRPQRLPVYIHVYDLVELPSYLEPASNALGIGIYHSGIEVKGAEYAFGGHDYEGITGVFRCQPRKGPPNAKYKTTIMHGFTLLSDDEIDNLLQDISKRFTGTSYNLLKRNCNTFTNEVANSLIGKGIPRWINRAATLGSWIPCFLPQEWIEPPDSEEQVAQMINENTMTPMSPIGRRYETMPYASVEQPLPPSDSLSEIRTL